MLSADNAILTNFIQVFKILPVEEQKELIKKLKEIRKKKKISNKKSAKRVFGLTVNRR